MENTTTETCPCGDVEFTVATENGDIEINFCPFCGDELYEEDEDDYEDDEDLDEEE